MNPTCSPAASSQRLSSALANCLVALLACCPSLRAATFTWNGGADDGLWHMEPASAANWAGAVYTADDTTRHDFIFTAPAYAGATVLTLLNHNPNAGSLLLNGNAPSLTFTIDGSGVVPGRLDLDAANPGDQTLLVLAGVHSIEALNSGRVQLQGNDQVWNIASGATLSINAVIESSGARGFTKAGGGTLALGVANTFTGKTRISEGTVSITTAGSLGALPGSYVADRVTLDGGKLHVLSATAASGSARGFTLSANGGTFDVNPGVTYTIQAQVTGPGGFVKIGEGTLSLTASNSFTGKILITEGALRVDSVNRFGTAPPALVPDQVTLDGGTLTFLTGTLDSGSTRGFRLGPGDGTFNVTSSALTLLGPVSGPGNLVKIGGGALELNHSANTYEGDTFFNEGALRIDGDGTLGSGTLHWNGATFGITATRSDILPNPIIMSVSTTIQNTTGAGAGTRIVSFGTDSITTTGGPLVIRNIATNATTMTARFHGAGFEFTETIMLDNGATPGNFAELGCFNPADTPQVFTGQIFGGGRVRRSAASAANAGVTIFGADNQYSGGTIISAGTLLVTNLFGSGTGSGLVAVSGSGVLGGNGSAAHVSIGSGGTLAPGLGVGQLAVDTLTLDGGGNIHVEMSAATGEPGANWDLVAVGGGAGEVACGATAESLFTVRLDSLGAAPANWNPNLPQQWKIISAAGFPGFDPGAFAVDTSLFADEVAGIFAVNAAADGLYLVYTPADDMVIDVPAGTQTQADSGHPVLSHQGGVSKTGAGELRLNNPLNSFAGSPKVLAGTLSVSVDAPVASDGALGHSTAAVLLGNNSGTSDAALNIDTDNVTVSRAISVRAGSTGAKTIGSTLTSGTAVFSGNVALNDSVTLRADGTAQVLFPGVFSGPGNITKTGNGTVSLTGANVFSGKTRVTGGMLSIVTPANLGAVPVSPDPDHITLDGGTIEFSTGTASSSSPRGFKLDTHSGTFRVTSSTFTILGPVSGPGHLIKTGPGTLDLNNAANTYEGDTILNEGTLRFDDDGTLGTGILRLNGGHLVSTSGRGNERPLLNPIEINADTIIQNTTGAGVNTTRIVPFATTTVAGSGGTFTIKNISMNANAVFTVRFTGGGLNFPHPFVLDQTESAADSMAELGLYSTNSDPAQVFTGVISGNGMVRRSHAAAGQGGSSILSGNNTYSGGTFLVRGFLGLGSDSVSSDGAVISGPLGTGALVIQNDSVVGLFAAGGARTVANSIVLDGVANTTIAGTNALTLAGDINLGGVSKTITVNNTALTTFSGSLNNTAPLTKAGPGSLVISGNNNLRTGATIVQEGALLVNNTVGNGVGTGPVTVQGLGVLGGTGIIGAPVQVMSGGAIAPGASVGTLTLNGGLDLSAGGVYVWELGALSTVNPGSFDQVVLVGGDLSLGGSSMVSLQFLEAAGAPNAANPFWQSERSWRIVSVLGAAANPGASNFSAIENGSFAAGNFATSVEPDGSILLHFIPGGSLPQPVLDPFISGAGTANATLTWSALEGRTYQVQYKDDLDAPEWSVLGNVTAGSVTVSFSDTTGPAPRRFYRLLLLP